MKNESVQHNPVNEPPKYNPISVGEWVITTIILAIPIVGFIMLFVWGFGSNTQPSKANWAKATLIMIGISIVLSFLFLGSLLGIMGSLMNRFANKTLELPVVFCFYNFNLGILPYQTGKQIKVNDI